jgi:hypothetical protein
MKLKLIKATKAYGFPLFLLYLIYIYLLIIYKNNFFNTVELTIHINFFNTVELTIHI